ncbi:citrate/2-methylcitrate synthase, partial [Staphylococcus aureus]
MKAPLHGSSNEHCMKKLSEIGVIETADAYLGEKFTNKSKVKGFGHSIYK